MKKGLTELVFILDKSGSMGGLEEDTIGGYNAMLKKQQEAAGECFITTVLFDSGYTLLHDRIDLRAVRPITQKEYEVGGSTALLDAIGRSIHKIGQVQKATAEDYRAQNVLFVIITDGQENASRKYRAGQVKALIQRQKSKYNWEFIFLGANIDAAETAESVGIDRDRAQNYHADPQGVKVNFSTVSQAAVNFRVTSRINEDWNQEIEADFVKRGGQS